MIEEVLGEEVDWVIGRRLKSLAQGLREHETDVVLLEISDVTVLFVKDRLLLLGRHSY